VKVLFKTSIFRLKKLLLKCKPLNVYLKMHVAQEKEKKFSNKIIGMNVLFNMIPK
jgi:hypothetical protein